MACKCKQKADRSWRVYQRKCHSDYGRTGGASRYSTVICETCDEVWRTKAAYVGALPDVPMRKTKGTNR